MENTASPADVSRERKRCGAAGPDKGTWTILSSLFSMVSLSSRSSAEARTKACARISILGDLVDHQREQRRPLIT
ncbi:MAG: hypothetical protein CL917_07255 [Deltaproteobacteria bacterium]|nr:hypothetical protein [Deltaproteobacteria bacterium]